MMGLDVDGTAILLVNLDDHIYAYSDACPHQKSRLSEGTLTENILRCARHQWEFDVCTGHGLNPEDACLKVFPVTIESGYIFLDLDLKEPAEAARDKESQP
jgi:nitrite reductase/ring-hydroxylating ferredoxin subunit